MNHATHFDSSFGLMRSSALPEYARDFSTASTAPAAQLTEQLPLSPVRPLTLKRVAVTGWIVGFLGAIIVQLIIHH